MNYCSISDIVSTIPNVELVQLTNDDGGDTVDETKITDAISYVGNIIDGYLRGRYTLPLTSIPDELKYISIDYVVYRLYCRRMYNNLPDVVSQRYKEIMKVLNDIQKGTFSLTSGTDEYANPITKVGNNIKVESEDVYYNSDKWKEYDSWLS